MDAESSEKLIEQTFDVSYQQGVVSNRDLAKRGTLTVRGGEFIFRGRERGAFFSGKETELRFRRSEMSRVQRVGTRLQFATPAGKSGKQGVPFVFFCSDEQTADVIADLLPLSPDPAVAEAHAFREKLQQLPHTTGMRCATNLIIAANVIMFVIMGTLGAGWLETADMDPYVRFAANNGAATTDGEWWRLITAMFTHYGVLHLALNMWALFQVGHLVERLLGRSAFVLMYFGSGIIGGLATIVWHGDKVWSAGASGAVFGVYGALIGYLSREKHGMPASVMQPMMKSTLTFAGYNLFFGAVQPHIDNVGHVGGLAGGLLLGWISALPLDRDVRSREGSRRLLLAGTAALALILVGIAVAPRFDYRVRDELALDEISKARGKQEQDLLAKQPGSKSGTAKADATQIAWVQGQVLPFYEHWRSEIAVLKLPPPFSTDRDAFVHILDLEIKSYRDLLDGMKRGDSSAGDRFAIAQKEIEAATAPSQPSK